MSHDFGPSSGDASTRAPGYGVPQQPYGQQQYQNGPSYGYAPPGPGYGTPQDPSPRAKIKPSIGWIVGVWLVAVLSVVVGIGGFVGGVFGALGDVLPTTSFGSGKTVTVKLDPAAGSVIYVSTTGPTDFECAFQGGPGTATLTRPQGQQTVTVNGVSWEMGLLVGVDKAGDYRLTCTADEAAGTEFGVGKELSTDSLLGGVIALFAVPSGGLLLAVIVTIVVLVRRSGARRRQAEAASAGQWGPQGPYGG
jgi:hypothetical protein